MNSRLIDFYRQNEFKVNFVASIVFIVVVYQIKYGLEILWPTNFGWLMRWDLAGYVILFDMYMDQPWGFPLGQVNNFFYPFGTNIVEFFPIIFKLFRLILPDKFQYAGLLLLSGHILMAYYALKVFGLLRVSGVVQLLVSLMIVINPVLLYRFIHPALTTQWMILASLWLYFLSSSGKETTRLLLYQAALFVLAGLIFPYLVIIVGCFVVALGFKVWFVDKFISFKKLFGYLGGSATALLLAWYALGLITFSGGADSQVPDAYGLYGWNLNSFFNPYDLDGNQYYKTNNLSSIFPAFPHVTWHQYEGFSYLGAGMLLLVILSLILYFTKKRPAVDPVAIERKTNLYPLAICVVLLTLFAISNKVTFNDHVLFTVPIPGVISKLGDVFRASGRFIWVAYYCILVAVLYFLAHTIRSRNALIGVFGGALILQVYDTKSLIFADHFPGGEYHTPLKDEQWQALIEPFDKIMFYPPYVSSNLTHDDYRYFTYFASNTNKPINTGYVGRMDFTGVGRLTRKMNQEVKKSIFYDSWLYVTTPANAPQLLGAYLDKKIDVVTLDGYLVFYSSTRTDLQPIANQIRASNDQGLAIDLFKLETPTSNPPVEKEATSLRANFYLAEAAENFVYLKGWGFIEGSDELEKDSVTVFLKAGNSTWAVAAKRFETPDVADYFHDKKLQFAGFSSAFSVSKELFRKKQLVVGVSIFNKKRGASGVQWLNGFVTFEEPWAEAQAMDATPAISDRVRVTFDVVDDKAEDMQVKGWALVEKLPISVIKPKVVLFSDSGNFSFAATKTVRDDVASYFKDSTLRHSGFQVSLKKAKLKKGTYHIGILLSDTVHHADYFATSDRIVSAGFPEFSRPSAMSGTPVGSDSVIAFIDKIEYQDEFVTFDGWAFINGLNTSQSETFIVVTSKKRMLSIPCTPKVRKDIQDHFKVPYDINMAGFSAKVMREDLPTGTYQVCLVVVNKPKRKQTMHCTDDELILE